MEARDRPVVGHGGEALDREVEIGVGAQAFFSGDGPEEYDPFGPKLVFEHRRRLSGSVPCVSMGLFLLRTGRFVTAAKGSPVPIEILVGNGHGRTVVV